MAKPLLLILLLGHLLNVVNATAGENPAPGQASTAFGLDLFAHLPAKPGNTFLSPYSISTCLALALSGARNTTESQMMAALHFQGNPQDVPRELAAVRQGLSEATNQVELDSANALWTQQGFAFLPAFLDVARQQFQAELNQADFRTQAAAATRQINHWVEGQTKGKIQNILPPGSLNSSTRLVLANAIYFKGAWERPFQKNATTEQPFRTAGGANVQVQMMHSTLELNYLETESFQVAELPYAGGRLSMLVFLPHDVAGLPALEKSLEAGGFSQWLDGLQRQRVDLFLPRFKIESEFELSAPLAAMGMHDAFTPAADFSAIDGRKDLFISAVRHKAWLDVTEAGTEAAAATTAQIVMNAMRRPTRPTPVFRADHPFLFLIRERSTGALLFLGRKDE